MLTFKEIELEIHKRRVLQGKIYDENLKIYDEDRKILEIIDCLEYNRAIIIENAIIQDICNILNGYRGKKIGPKTQEKIINEVNNLPFIKNNDLRVYLSDYIIVTYIEDPLYYFLCKKNLLRDIFSDLQYNNKIFSINDFRINNYIDDIEDYIKQINLAKENIYSKFNELKKIVNDYNLLRKYGIHKYIDLSMIEG